MSTALASFQRHFVQALRGDEDGAPWARSPAFAVYRNTTLLGATDALRANYPVVAQLVGDAWFQGVAERFARAQPPQDVRLLLYGAGFADFLAPAAEAHDLPYLVDVARLDRAWTESHVAADAPVLQAHALSQLAPEALPALVLVPHPAARWRWCADTPAFTIWSRHRAPADDGLDAPLGWHGEGALLTRPTGAVRWQALDAAGATLLQACADGQPLPEALQAAWQTDPQADVGALLAQLIGAGAFCALPAAA